MQQIFEYNSRELLLIAGECSGGNGWTWPDRRQRKLGAAKVHSTSEWIIVVVIDYCHNTFLVLTYAVVTESL